jgi:hypothetical protein
MTTKHIVLKKQSKTPLLVHGQGVFLFESSSPCKFYIFDSDKCSGLSVEFTSTNVHVTEIPSDISLTDPYNSSGLTNKKGAYYWFSLDSQNQTLCAGIGEARLETMIYQYKFSNRKESKEFLEGLINIHIPKESKSLKPLRLLRDPITQHIPLIVKNTDDLTMNDIAKATFLPKSTLSSVSQQMYDCISGKNFILNDKDFPDFSKAIQHSIVTPGLWCYKTLQKKATEFGNKPNLEETYIRITLNQNNGESPGIPYVMEIWPIGHYSPVHSHSEADAIIRVLHGSIHVTLFPYLCYDKEGVEPFGCADFKKDEITWISPTLNQTHQLENIGTDVCVTIQCYMYEQDDREHYDYFDYLDENGDKKQYEPDSDMDFVNFKDLMLLEFTTRRT